MLDTAAGCAAQSVLGPGQIYTSAEIKVSFLRATRAGDGHLRATGRIVHAGRRLITAEAHLHDERDRLIAHATTTCLVLEAPTRPTER